MLWEPLLGSFPTLHKDVQSWLEARGCSGRAFPGTLEQALFFTDIFGKEVDVFSTNDFIEKAVGLFFFPFFSFFLPFPSQQPYLRKRFLFASVNLVKNRSVKMQQKNGKY